MIVAAITHLVLNRSAPRLAALRWRGSRLMRRLGGRRVLGRRPDRAGPRLLSASRHALLPRR